MRPSIAIRLAAFTLLIGAILLLTRNIFMVAGATIAGAEAINKHREGK